MAPATLVGRQRRTAPCPPSYAIMQDGGHAEPVITARAQLRVAGHAFVRPVGFTHPADCELICFARKRNLDAQLRQNNTTGKSVKTCPAIRARDVAGKPRAISAARMPPHIQLSSPAKAGDPVFQRRLMIKPIGRGVLDTPLSRSMTAEDDAGPSKQKRRGMTPPS